MKFETRLGALALAGIVTAFAANAADPEVTLTVHHFLSPKATTQTTMIEPWAKAIEEASEGRIKFEIFPSMAMGGKPPELYRQARDGSADIVWTLIGYTPGVFPRTEAFELPTVHQGSATATNLAIQDTFSLIADDYTDIHPLLVHVHAGNAMHLVKPTDANADDAYKGLKLRTPSRTGAWMIEELGAEPVGMPVPALPQALAKGTVDGALVPFEIFPPLKLQDLTVQSIEGANGERFGTSVFLYAMNKERYDALPDDLRKIIDDHSGRNFAQKMGEVWDAAEDVGKQKQTDTDGEIVSLGEAATAKIAERGEKVVARWVEELSSKDIDAAAIIDAAREAVKKNSAE